MDIKLLDGFAIFTSQKEQRGTFYIRLEKEGRLLLNGSPIEEGRRALVFRLSPTDLLEGENTVAVSVGGERFLCQSLYRHGATVKPLSFPTEKTVLSLLNRVDELTLRLEKAEQAIEALSTRFLGASLF